MKININICLIVIFFAVSNSSFAADTILIDITYKYKLDENGNNAGFLTTRQKLLTTDNVVFREVSYDENRGDMSGYIFYFYRNSRMFTKEYYNSKDSLLYILKFDYDNKGNESTITKLTINKGKTEIIEKTVKTYNADSKILTLKKYYGNKAGVISKYKYDPKGLLLNEKIVYKTFANDTFKSEIKEYSYSQDNKIEKITINKKGFSGVSIMLVDKYSYNEKGLVSSVKQFKSDGTPIKEYVYKYGERGFPSAYEEYDAKGKKTLFLQYDYKKHFMEKGIQVSRYENL